ncbi:MAG: hypothetical protein Q9211_002122 [Gyalolechia sp. 1 TL-2023]
MGVQDLNARLQPLQDAHKQTIRLIHRLSKLSSTPGASSLDPEAGDARVELSTEIHQNLKEQEEDFELLRQEVEDQTNTAGWTLAAKRRDSGEEKELTDLAAQVARLAGDQKLARAQFRKAQLQAKRNAEAAKRKERELLFARVQEGGDTAVRGRRKGQEQLTKDQLEATASADVTAALRRVHSLMQSEVSKSQFALETLHQSTAALSSLSESYTDLDTLLSSSRNLVSTLLHSQKSDTWYLESAFWILVSTIAWLVFRRLLYGPGWWLVYLPTTLVWRLTLVTIRLVFGAFAYLAGVAGANNQSTALARASSQALSKPPSATGEIPKFRPGMSAPSIQVGGGGKGQPHPQRPQDGQRSISDAVGKMAEETLGNTSTGNPATKQSDQQTTLRERRTDEPPNPKKPPLFEMEALRDDRKALYCNTLPSLAISNSPVQNSWPVHVDHCFGRIILDNVIGRDTPRMSKLTSLAAKNMTSVELEKCIALGNAIAEGRQDLAELDAKSLQLRGKEQKPAANKKRKREAVDQAASEQKEASPSKKRQLDIRSALLPSQLSKDLPPYHPSASTSPAPKRSSGSSPIDPDLYNLITVSNLTTFRQRVLLALCQVPPGHFTTYIALSTHLHSSARAVGNALRNNPFAPRVPCHRVVAADKGLGGFRGAWGKDGKHAKEKVRLLRGEGVIVDVGKGRVDGSIWKAFM